MTTLPLITTFHFLFTCFNSMKIGIIREGKTPPDRRVPLTPRQCTLIRRLYPHIEIYIQPSPIRCYADEEYAAEGLPLTEDLSHCDVLLGIKEVPIPQLIANKIYFFFSHTIKKQAYNRPLLQALLQKHITMVDYETLTDEKGNRLIAFGHYAGLVGAYNGILAYGEKYNLFHLKPAHQCFDRHELIFGLHKLALPPIKIAVTGSGRVAKGAMEMLHEMKIERVDVMEYLNQKQFSMPVYTQLSSSAYHVHKKGRKFIPEEFYSFPEHFESHFEPFYRNTDLLIAAAYWHPKAPRLFTAEEMKREDFRIRVIADITCDIDGSIPSTKRPSKIGDPVYDYNRFTGEVEAPYSNPENVSVMAIDNLPSELPRDASEEFGGIFIERILAHLLNDAEGIIARATITKGGHLTRRYAYLQAFAEGKE